MQNFGVSDKSRGWTKAFVIALDSTPFHYLQDNIDSLPNLGKIIKQGHLITTKSPATLLSAGPWQTFASGLLPGEQGHYFPLQWDPSLMKFVPIKENSLVFEPFWNDLARSGVETIVFDAMSVPVTKDMPGIQVFNWNTQSNFASNSNRPEILQEIKRRFGNKPIGNEIPVKKSRKKLARDRDRLIRSARLKTDAMIWLMQKFEWDLFITAYYEGHRAGHNFWPIWEDFASDPPEDAMLDVYRELDVQFGRLLSALDLSDTALVLFSMHGMTAGFSQDHFLLPVMDRINALYLSERGLTAATRRGPGIARFLRQTVPPFVQRGIREVVGQTIQDWLIDKEWRGGKDWQATPALPVPGGGDVGFIRLNIRGRERDGFLPASAEERSDYLEFLCRHLDALRVKPTNQKLIRKIVMTDEEFPGPLSSRLPDVLLVWGPEDPATEIWSNELGTIKASLKTGRGGNHTGDSFAVLAGAVGDVEELPALDHIRDYSGFFRQLLTPEARVKEIAL